MYCLKIEVIGLEDVLFENRGYRAGRCTVSKQVIGLEDVLFENRGYRTGRCTV